MLDSNKHDFSSLSIKDLLDAREAYHVHLAHLKEVYATAIGRYLIRKSDKNAKDSKHHTNPQSLGTRTPTVSMCRAPVHPPERGASWKSGLP